MQDKISFLKFFFDSGKYAEDSVRTSAMTDLFPAIIYCYDVDSGKISFINKKFTEYFGLTFKDVKEDENIILDIVFKDDVDLVKKELQKLYTPAVDQCQFESRLNHKAGEWNYFKTQVNVLARNTSGKVRTLLFVAQDVTHERKNVQHVDSLKNLFDETEGLLQFGSWTLNVATDTIHCTSGLLSLLEYNAGDIEQPIRKSFYMDHVVNGYKDNLQEVIDRAIYTRTDFEYEYVIQSRTSQHKIVVTKGKVVPDANGAVRTIVGITRDITTLRNIEKEQERHIRQLNKSNKELEEFAYVASHDLQEPLRKIAMFADRLKLKFGDSLDQEGELFLDRILASSVSMKLLIDNLLEFSRTSRTSHNFSCTELQGIINDVIGDLELKIEETGSKIVVEGTLPKVEAVPSEMKQLFTNLLSNSIKFRKDSNPAEIELSIRKLSKEQKKIHQLNTQKTYYKIDVRDRGIGFEAEYTEKIFQVFQRLHGRTEYPGSGIGLAICKKIVDNHNGVISAHSIPNEGATFTVILPEKQL